MNELEKNEGLVMQGLLEKARSILANPSSFITADRGQIIEELYAGLEGSKLNLDDLPLSGEEKERLSALSNDWFEVQVSGTD